MKPYSKYLLLPLLALSFLFQACRDDDDKVSREEMLIGAWTIQSNELTDYSITVSGFTFTKDNIQGSPLEEQAQEFEESLAELSESLFPPNTTITFNDDNTYVLTNPNSPDSFQDIWAMSSDEQNLTLDINNDEINSLVFDIEELTSNTLRVLLNIDDDDIDLVDENGEEIPVDGFTIEYTFNFTK